MAKARAQRGTGTLGRVAFALCAATGLAATGCANLMDLGVFGAPACAGSWVDSSQIAPHEGLRLRYAIEALEAPAPRGDAPAGGAPARIRGELVTGLADVPGDPAGRLTVIGLTPFGTRAFSARWVGREIALDAGVARHMGIEPWHLLDALNAFFETAPPPGAFDVENPACGYRVKLLVPSTVPTLRREQTG